MTTAGERGRASTQCRRRACAAKLQRYVGGQAVVAWFAAKPSPPTLPAFFFQERGGRTDVCRETERQQHPTPT